jgi:hypothetical protein
VEAFAQGVFADEGVQLGHELLVLAELEVEPDPLLDDGEPPLVEGGRAAPDQLTVEPVECRPPPEGERGVQPRDGVGGVAVPGGVLGGGDQAGELRGVDVLGAELQPVPGRDGLDGVRMAGLGEELAEPGDADLDLPTGRLGRLFPPHGGDQRVEGGHPLDVEAEHREHRPLPRPTDVQRPPPGDDLDRTEKP